MENKDLAGYLLIKKSQLIHWFVEIDKILENDDEEEALKKLRDLQTEILNSYR